MAEHPELSAMVERLASSDIAAAWFETAYCYPPDYVDRVQLRSTYTSIREASDDITHQLIALTERPDEFGYEMLHRETAPEIAQILLGRGRWSLMRPESRTLALDQTHSSLQNLSIGPNPPSSGASHSMEANQHTGAPARSPITESSIWEPLDHYASDLLTLEPFPSISAPPSYSDAVAQHSNVDRIQPSRRNSSGRRAQRHQPTTPTYSRAVNGRNGHPQRVQSSTLNLWPDAGSRRSQKVTINVTAARMDNGNHFISIECDGDYINGGVIGKNVSIVTNLLCDRACSNQGRANQRRSGEPRWT